jgi:hypothetical protein
MDHSHDGLSTEVERTCTWTEDIEDGNFWTTCGETWEFIDGNIADNRVKFCHYCGGHVVPVYAIAEQLLSCDPHGRMTGD